MKLTWGWSPTIRLFVFQIKQKIIIHPRRWTSSPAISHLNVTRWEVWGLVGGLRCEVGMKCDTNREAASSDDSHIILTFYFVWERSVVRLLLLRCSGVSSLHAGEMAGLDWLLSLLADCQTQSVVPAPSLDCQLQHQQLSNIPPSPSPDSRRREARPTSIFISLPSNKPHVTKTGRGNTH